VSIAGEKTLLVKPTTFYNETGRSARALLDFYKLDPADLLVIHDDIALPFGTIRVRQKGSDAGNNGIKSLNAHIGQEYWRLRIGIWSELCDRQHDADFVLSRFTKDEINHLTSAVSTVVHQLATEFCSDTLQITSHATLLPNKNTA
jgi:PTH1 family peptidyl-tRNA hydrolase